LIPNACDRSESSILELGEKKEEIQGEACVATSDIDASEIAVCEPAGKRFKSANRKIKRAEFEQDVGSAKLFSQSALRDSGNGEIGCDTYADILAGPASHGVGSAASTTICGASYDTDLQDRAGLKLGTAQLRQEEKNTEGPPAKRRRIEVQVNRFTSLLLANVRSVRQKTNHAQLCIQLEQEKPDFVALNETWLNDSTGSLSIPGYRSTARRDRRDSVKKQGGGVDLYCKNSIRNIGFPRR